MLGKLRFFYLIHPFRTAGKAMRSLGGKNALPSLALALAGTLGVGNVFGVCLGIIIGGAGSVFWLFASALISAVLKYSEVVITHDNLLHAHDGSHGGMFYSIAAAFRRTGKGMALVYAASCLLLSLVMGAALQSGTARETMTEIFDTPPAFLGIILVALIFVSIIWGVGTIEKITLFAIPATTIIYITITLGIIAVNFSRIGDALYAVMYGAFTFEGAVGGVMAFLFSSSVREGYSRGILSNEAGCGTSSLAHSRSGILNPAVAGLMGIVEVFFDTCVLCMLTAFAVLTAVPDYRTCTTGMSLILTAAASSLGQPSVIAVFVCVLVFAYSTILCWYYYGRECFRYLFGNRLPILFLPLYLVFVFLGMVVDNRALVALTDGLMLILACLSSLTVIKRSDRIKLLSERGGVIDPRTGRESVSLRGRGRR